MAPNLINFNFLNHNAIKSSDSGAPQSDFFVRCYKTPLTDAGLIDFLTAFCYIIFVILYLNKSKHKSKHKISLAAICSGNKIGEDDLSLMA